MIEKVLASIAPQAFTSNGTSLGLVTIASTAGFVTKQKVTIQGTALADLGNLEVKGVLSSTTLLVGPVGTALNVYSNISTYTTAASSTIRAESQKRPTIPLTDIERAVFAEEPVVATRTIQVDQFGNYITASNPLPVDASVTATTEVQVLNSALGISAFSLATADVTQTAVDISTYVRGSIEITWSGATSSDAFVSQGAFDVLIGNTSSPTAILTTISIGAASGSFLYRGLDADMRYIAIKWTKNNSTAGSATISATFKGA